MDPLSHLIIGLGLATLSGKPITLGDPIYLACAVGAIIPDLDIVWQLKGHLAYLKHHRGSSHSLIGIAITALLIGGILKFIFPQSLLWELIGWAFIGTLSHSLFDILNSYGVQLLYPLKMNKITMNLVQIFDPVIIAIFGMMAWSERAGGTGSWKVLIALPIYLGLRWVMRSHLYKRIRGKKKDAEIVSLVLLPSLLGIMKWDYLLETEQARQVGSVALHWQELRTFKHLSKTELNDPMNKAMNTKVGEIFQKFTPYFHISHCIEGTRHIISFIDLRYQTGQDFKHSATVVLENGEQLVEEIFHPYNKNRNVRVM